MAGGKHAPKLLRSVHLAQRLRLNEASTLVLIPLAGDLAVDETHAGEPSLSLCVTDGWAR
jgi:hypothetical protein